MWVVYFLFLFLVFLPLLLSLFFFFNDTATTEIYTLSLHDALPIFIISRLARQLMCAKCMRPLVSCARRQSRATIEASLEAGIPFIPSNADFLPSFSIPDRKSTRLNSSHIPLSRMPSSA